MRLVFIGPPGSGKGTQAQLLSERLGLRHYSTGNILRESIEKQTAEGQLASPFVSTGQLVPDDVVNEIVNSRFRAADRASRFVMDGYPRTLAQAHSFYNTLTEHGLPLEGVIFLKVDDDELIRRTSGRWSCPNLACKSTYHTVYAPPKKPGICDRCGTPLVQRDDDKPETVAKRLKIFHSLYDALVDYYRQKGLLIEVPGVGDVETIYKNIVKALAERKLK